MKLLLSQGLAVRLQLWVMNTIASLFGWVGIQVTMEIEMKKLEPFVNLLYHNPFIHNLIEWSYEPGTRWNIKRTDTLTDVLSNFFIIQQILVSATTIQCSHFKPLYNQSEAKKIAGVQKTWNLHLAVDPFDSHRHVWILQVSLSIAFVLGASYSDHSILLKLHWH